MQKLCRDEILLKNLFVKDLEDRIVVKKNIPFNYHFLFPPRRGIRLELLEVIIMDIHAPMIYTRLLSDLIVDSTQSVPDK